MSGLTIMEQLFSTRFSGAVSVLASEESKSGDTIPLWVFGITCGLEFLQLWHPGFGTVSLHLLGRILVAPFLVGFSSLCGGLSFGLVLAGKLTKNFLTAEIESGKREDAMQKRVKVKPNSKHQSIEEDRMVAVHLKSPPVDGKANEELIKTLAKKFDVPKSQSE